SRARLCSDGQVVFVTGGGETVTALVWCESGAGIADGRPEGGHGAGDRGSQQMLQLSEDLLDGVEVGTVGRKVVEDYGVAGAQHRDEAVFDVAAEARTVGGAIDEAERAQAGGAQRRGDGRGLVVPLRHEQSAALATQGASVAAGHVGGGCGLVEEHEGVGPRTEPLFTGDAVASEEPRQSARAGLHAPRGQDVAQLAQEDLGSGLVGGQDQIGLRIEGREAIIAVGRVGRDVAFLGEPRRPSACTRHAHTEPGCRSMEGSALGHGRHHALAQIDRQR
ncbi:hypothetical protein C1645_842790, partial [Glomus cerebriforme]